MSKRTSQVLRALATGPFRNVKEPLWENLRNSPAQAFVYGGNDSTPKDVRVLAVTLQAALDKSEADAETAVGALVLNIEHEVMFIGNPAVTLERCAEHMKQTADLFTRMSMPTK